MIKFTILSASKHQPRHAATDNNFGSEAEVRNKRRLTLNICFKATLYVSLQDAFEVAYPGLSGWKGEL